MSVFRHASVVLRPHRRWALALLGTVALNAGGAVQAAMVSQTIFFNITGFFPTGVEQNIPAATVSGAVAFTYEDSILNLQQDSSALIPTVFVDAVNLTIDNAQSPGAARTYAVGEVAISLRVDTGGFLFKDTLGAVHGGEQGTDGFLLLFDKFNDFVNIDYISGSYTVSTVQNGLWGSLTGTATAVAGNQINPIPLPAPLATFAACSALIAARRRRAG